MPNTNPASLNRASNADWVSNAHDKGDMSGAAAVRKRNIDKALGSEATDPGNFDAREAAKAALANASKG